MTRDSDAAPRLLIVEDDPAMRQMLVARFRSGGYDVSEAADVRDALIQAPVGRFDLVLTDIHLPGPSGIDLARSLQESAPTVPVVFVSGDSNVDLIREALNTESSAAYMVKPFSMADLDAVVELVLRNPRAFTTPDIAEIKRLSDVTPIEPARYKNRIAHLLDDLVIPTEAPVERSPVHEATAPAAASPPVERRGLTTRMIVTIAILVVLAIIVTIALRAPGNALQPVELSSLLDVVSTAGTPRT